MNKENQVFIITGTRKGIGLDLANHFLKLNKVVYGCSRGSSSIDHENYKHFELDVADEKSVIQMVRQVRKENKKIDVLINNAGIALMNHITLTSKSSVDKIFNTNFLGTFLFTREVSKAMIRQKYGRVVNFTTVAVPLNLEGEAIYSSSKSAVETLTRISAKELGHYGITVNAIGPSPVMTDLIRLVPRNKIDILLKQQAISRFGQFKDVLNVLNFFIDNNSDFITGQIIYLGGVS